MNEPKPIEIESTVLTLSAETETTALALSAEAATIAELLRRARRLRRLYKATAAFSIVSAVVITVANFALMHLNPGSTPWVFNLYFPLMLFNAFPSFLAKRRRKTIKLLTEAAGLQEIGPLVEGFDMMETNVVTMELLVNFLPRLQSSDAHLLTPQHHRILNRQLSGKYHLYRGSRIAFILATLKSYEQIGGMEDLPTVARLAQGKGYAKQNYNIRKAAQECLPYLQARSEGQELRQTLLRASSGNADNAATLLRPTAANGGDPAQLLRASHSETPE